MRGRNPNTLQAPAYTYAHGKKRRAHGAAPPLADAHVRAYAKARPCWGLKWVIASMALAFVTVSPNTVGELAGTVFGIWLILAAVLTLMLTPLPLFAWIVCAGRRSYPSAAGRRFGVLMAWTWKTYLVWALFSLYNFNMLGLLMMPPMLPIMWHRYAPFVPFMAPPFALALLVTGWAYLRLRHALFAWGLRAAAPFFFNVFLLATLLGGAEGYRAFLMTREISTFHPACVRTDTFLSSVLAGWEEFQFHTHGVLVEDGVVYLWSYREREFVAQSPRLEGFSCMPAQENLH